MLLASHERRDCVYTGAYARTDSRTHGAKSGADSSSEASGPEHLVLSGGELARAVHHPEEPADVGDITHHGIATSRLAADSLPLHLRHTGTHAGGRNRRRDRASRTGILTCCGCANLPLLEAVLPLERIIYLSHHF
jgi:hypothetical protein